MILVVTVERKIQVWHDVHVWARHLLKKTLEGWNSLSRVDLAMFLRRVSLLWVAVLRKLFQQVTHRNQLSVLLGQHDFINFCNFSRVILKKGSFTSVLADHKKGILPLKRVFLSESQRPVRRLSNQIFLDWEHTKVFWRTNTINIYVTLYNSWFFLRFFVSESSMKTKNFR